MKLILLFFAIAITSVLATPVLVDVEEEQFRSTPLYRRDVNVDQFEEVRLVKRTGRHVHHIPGHHGHIGHHVKKIKKGKKAKKMMATASPAAVTNADTAAAV